MSPCDGIYNCIFYNIDNCTEGVSGFKDVLKHSQWLGKKVQNSLGLKTRVMNHKRLLALLNLDYPYFINFKLDYLFSQRISITSIQYLR